MPYGKRDFQNYKHSKVTEGHCDVPAQWTDNPQLGKWVINQRTNKKKGTLSERPYPASQSDWFCVGYSDNASWEKKFAELEAFRESYGHCNVPTGWHKNPQLATWVTVQRLSM
jgi:hypothetical protein